MTRSKRDVSTVSIYGKWIQPNNYFRPFEKGDNFCRQKVSFLVFKTFQKCAPLKGLNLHSSLKVGHNEKGSKNFNV